MPVDVSMYAAPTGAAAPVNPMDQLSKMLGIQQAMNQNAMFQQEFKARQAMGPLMQQSIDPKTGEFDLSKLAVLGSANPDVAWKMPEMMNQIIQRQNLQADTVVKELKVAKDRWDTMGGVSTGLVGTAMQRAGVRVGPNGGPAAPYVTQGEYAQSMSELVAAGIMDAKEAATRIADSSKLTDQQRFTQVQQFANSAGPISDGLSRIYGTIDKTKTGGGTTFTRNSPMTGVSQVGSLDETPSPQDRNSLVTVTDENGKQHQVPRASQPMQTGSGAPAAATGPQAAPGTVPNDPILGPSSNFGGTIVGSQSGPIQGTLPAGANGAAPANSPPGANGGFTTSQTPAAAAVSKGAGDNFVAYQKDLQDSNVAVGNTLRMMTEMKTALQQFKAGGGMEVREKLATLAQGMGGDQKLVDSIAGGNLGAIQEFQKLAVAYATGEMKTNMGSSQRLTNLDFGTFLKNNPTINTDSRALDKMFNWVKTRSNPLIQEQAMMDMWQSGKRPNGYEDRGMEAFPAWWSQVLAKSRNDGTAAAKPTGGQ